ncbi:MAG: hypothetical protein QOH96_4117 [Blastocatellia bacterium]|nr:hypothetical protein [Blastocatellia bacterium]
MEAGIYTGYHSVEVLNREKRHKSDRQKLLRVFDNSSKKAKAPVVTQEPSLFQQKSNFNRMVRVGRGTARPLQSSAPDRRAQVPGIPIRVGNTPYPVTIVLISGRRGGLCTCFHRACKPTVNIVHIEIKCPG